MIRRGFWLTVGAVIGVTGYRRATRLARSILPAAPATPATPAARAGRSRLALTRPEQRRDRPGRDELGRRAVVAAASAGRSAAASAAFVRDVRDGMAEYLDRHDGRVPRSLEDSQGRQEPGAGPAAPAPAPAGDSAPGGRRRQAR